MGNGSDSPGVRGRAEKESSGSRMQGFEVLVEFAAAGGRTGMDGRAAKSMRYGCPWVAAGGTS